MMARSSSSPTHTATSISQDWLVITKGNKISLVHYRKSSAPDNGKFLPANPSSDRCVSVRFRCTLTGCVSWLARLYSRCLVRSLAADSRKENEMGRIFLSVFLLFILILFLSRFVFFFVPFISIFTGFFYLLYVLLFFKFEVRLPTNGTEVRTKCPESHQQTNKG
jgi:hypothetical protein